MDPDKQGEILWEYRAGKGGTLGGIEWGATVDAEQAYFPVADGNSPTPGGLHAVNLMTGARVWFTPPPDPPACGARGRGCSGAQSAAITAIPGIVFSPSNDGAVRAFATKDGAIVWQFDYEPRVSDVERRQGTRRIDERSCAGRRRRHALREFRLRRVRVAHR